MDRSNFFNSQLVVAEDLNNIEFTKASQSIIRSLAPLAKPGGYGKNGSYLSPLNDYYAVSGGGIFGYPTDPSGSAGQFAATAWSSTQIDVAAGRAIDPTGELIVSTAPISCTLGGSGTTWEWTAESSVIQFVKLRHISTPGTYKSDDFGASHPTRYTDTYHVSINSTPPTANELVLAAFLCTGSGEIFGAVPFVDFRRYVRTVTPADSVFLDPSYYFPAGWRSVEDHVFATGSQVPSQKNAHGLTFQDMGYNQPYYAMYDHRRGWHCNGIVRVSGSVFDSKSYDGVWTVGPGSYITFNTASVGTWLSVGNDVYAGNISTVLTTADAPSTGYYWVVADKNGVASFKPYSSYPPIQEDPWAMPDYVRLGIAYVDTVSTGLLYVDMRDFHAITPNMIRADFVEATADPITVASNIIHRASASIINDDRMRYMIGMALSGTGSNWREVTAGYPAHAYVNPLTKGPTSNADNLHTHSSLTGATSTLNTVQSLRFPNWEPWVPGVTASATGSLLQNTTGKHMFLNLNVHTTGGGNLALQVMPGYDPAHDWSSFYDAVDFTQVEAVTEMDIKLHGIVPPGYWWRASGSVVGPSTMTYGDWSVHATILPF